ncbi:MAG: CYTH domain-containing protein [Desulfomonilaceae bacterium]
MNTTSVDSIERELTLLVSSDDPDVMLSKIGEMVSIDDYILGRAGSFLIRDYYFDTAAGELSRQKWALRIRREGEQVWITVKGPSRESKGGILERTEMELPWSPKAFAILSSLPVTQSLSISPFQKIRTPGDALETFINAGLIVIQKRDTRRVIKHIRHIMTNQVIAELALDRVIYHIDDKALRHHEIEIESKGKEGVSVVQHIAEYLLRLYPDELRKWPHTKFATGRAIQALLSEESFENTLGLNDLKTASYGLIEKYLARDE